MADADANKPPPPPSDADAPIASISPSDSAAAIEEQLAGLGLTVAGGGAGFEPSGWDDSPDPTPAPVLYGGGGDEAVPDGKAQQQQGEEVVVVAPSPADAAADARVRYPRRPGEPDCSYFVKFGACRFGNKCKFNHPARRKKSSRVKGSGGSGSNSSSSNKASSPDDDQAAKEEYEGLAPDISDSSFQGSDEKGSASNSVQGISDKGRADTSENHWKASDEIASEPEKGSYFKKLDETNATKHKVTKDKRKETVAEGSAQEECKYYATPGGCKFGKACKYLHREGKEGKPGTENADLNFLGLPLRPGEKECPFYMRAGGCKYSSNCKFHHPDPSIVSPKEPVLEHENGAMPHQNVQGPSQTSVPIWPGQRAMNEQHVPFVAPAQSYNAGMMPPQGVYSSPHWSGYHQHFTAPSTPNHRMYKAADIPGHQQVAIDEYPERPGQPECQHFVRSGSCKYKMKCRYHHPRSQHPALPATGLSPLGLPIKPDKPVCSYYGRFGVCKYGPACMFNHPFNFGPHVHAAGPFVPSSCGAMIWPRPGPKQRQH